MRQRRYTGTVAEEFRLLPAGWCRFTPAADPTLVVTARFTVAPTGRIAVAEMAFARFPTLTADSLRTVPIGRLEAWANGPGRQHLEAGISIRDAVPVDELAEIDSRARSEADQRARWGTDQDAQASQQSWDHAAGDLGVSEQVGAGYTALGLEWDGSVVPLRSRVRNLRLQIPKGQPKPDRFYRDLARLYGEVALNSSRPAAVIAEANTVPVSTVHGWVKEARRRGLLAPGERRARQAPSSRRQRNKGER